MIQLGEPPNPLPAKLRPSKPLMKTHEIQLHLLTNERSMIVQPPIRRRRPSPVAHIPEIRQFAPNGRLRAIDLEAKSQVKSAQIGERILRSTLVVFIINLKLVGPPPQKNTFNESAHQK